MKRAIITGPTGAIGIALVQELLNNGVDVTAVCRNGSARIERLPVNEHLHIVECNLDVLKRLPEMLTGQYDVFYHFAWACTVGDSRNNVEAQLKNIQYTIDAVEVAKDLGCKKFIGAGSQAEYGRYEGELNAQVPTFPENGYGIAKLCAGQLSRIRCEQLGIEHIWTRILSVYGPYDGENTMIMSTIRALLKGERPALTKGEQQWDYLYSRDAAMAMYLLGESGVHGKVYCLGSGRADRLVNYIYTLRDVISPDAELGIGAVPYGNKQVMYLCADISELVQDTGFKPGYSFEQGIKETIKWVKGNE